MSFQKFAWGVGRQPRLKLPLPPRRLGTQRGQRRHQCGAGQLLCACDGHRTGKIEFLQINGHHNYLLLRLGIKASKNPRTKVRRNLINYPIKKYIGGQGVCSLTQGGRGRGFGPKGGSIRKLNNKSFYGRLSLLNILGNFLIVCGPGKSRPKVKILPLFWPTPKLNSA